MVMDTSRCFDSQVTFISKCPDICGFLTRLRYRQPASLGSPLLDDWSPSRRPDTFEMLQSFWLHDPLVTLHFTAFSHLLLLCPFQCSLARTSPSSESDTTSSTIAVLTSVSSQRLSNVLSESPSASTTDAYTHSSTGIKTIGDLSSCVKNTVYVTDSIQRKCDNNSYNLKLDMTINFKMSITQNKLMDDKL